MIQKFGTFLLGALVCFLAMYFLDMGKSDARVKELQLQNDSLFKANLVLDSLEDTYISKMNEANYEILQLESEDNALEYKVKYMNKEINIIKTKYEKARNYANGFGSDDIRRYFAELK
jgi:hypothetical protein